MKAVAWRFTVASKKGEGAGDTTIPTGFPPAGGALRKVKGHRNDVCRFDSHVRSFAGADRNTRSFRSPLAPRTASAVISALVFPS